LAGGQQDENEKKNSGGIQNGIGAKVNPEDPNFNKITHGFKQQ